MTVAQIFRLDFICYNKTEQFLSVSPDRNFPIGSLNDVKLLGTAFCSLINSKNDINIFKNNILANISKYIQYESVEDNLNFIFKKFVSVNEYFILTHYLFFMGYKAITDDLKNNVNNDDILDIYKNNLNIIFNQIITGLHRNDELFSYSNKGYYLPEAIITFDENQKNIKYNYTVFKNFELVLTASYYQFFVNKLHLKKCNYPKCNKLFTTSYGQTKRCENPCPDNPNFTCRSVSRNFDRHNEVQSPLEREVDYLGEQLKRLCEQYRYYASTEKQKRKREMIINNSKILKNVSADLRRKIKANSIEPQYNNYLKIYKNFLDEVESNLKSSPKVFKIKKPKY